MNALCLISPDEVRRKALVERLRPYGFSVRIFCTLAEFRTGIKEPEVGSSFLVLYVPPPLQIRAYDDDLIALTELRGKGINTAVICMSTDQPLVQSTKVLNLPTFFYDGAVDLGLQIRNQIAGKPLRQGSRRAGQELTPREQSVLLGLKAGLLLKEISANLGISANTASTYKARLMKKLNYTNNAQLMRGSRNDD